MEFMAPSFKSSCFFRRPLRVFHQCFFRCFHFTTEFYYWWLHLFISSTLGIFITVSSGVFISPLTLTIVFGCFHFTNFLYHDYFFVTYFTLCCCTAGATDLKELFLLPGVFYLTLLPDIWHNGMLHQPAFIKASLRAGSSSLNVAGPPTEVQNTDPAHLLVWIT